VERDTQANAELDPQRARNDRDRELFIRFAAGDDRAFRELFHIHSHRLYLYCSKILDNKTLARDVVQDTWERLIRYRNASKETPRSVQALLLRIARNLCYNQIRGRRDHLSLDELPQWRQPGGTTEMSEAEEAVVIALSRLPIRQREIVILHEYSGYGYDEIAEILELPVGTIRTRAWRARAQLGRLIAALIGMNDESTTDDNAPEERQ
jgi:RNA polymerase sigma-70 factor (ECF subfamily)